MKRIVILGGDERQRYLTEALREAGYPVVPAGMPWDVPQEQTDLFALLRNASAVVLPLPATRDGETVSGLRTKEGSLSFRTLAEAVPPDTRILGGAIPAEWRRAAEARGLAMDDYYDPAVQLRNALPTAEGAIRLAMEALPVTLGGTTFAISGSGRIAGLLAGRLSALGANVVVLARDPLARISLGFDRVKTLPLTDEGLRSIPADCRLLFNTVPARVLTPDRVALLPRNCILMELASAPGGFDPLAAGAAGYRVIPAGGLPGKFFPESAGKILAQAIAEAIGDP